ncbi:MAG TPA: hypothetical protein VMH23_14045 [Bacteroidota bacterium]|nr:hypothetical protein [Bacteroidota bacterium]
MPSTVREQAILLLLKPPALRYLQQLKTLIDRDPAYLESHHDDVGNIIIGFLSGSGFHWHRDIFDREWPEIVRLALTRLGKNGRPKKNWMMK